MHIGHHVHVSAQLHNGCRPWVPVYAGVHISANGMHLGHVSWVTIFFVRPKACWESNTVLSGHWSQHCWCCSRCGCGRPNCFFHSLYGLPRIPSVPGIKRKQNAWLVTNGPLLKSLISLLLMADTKPQIRKRVYVLHSCRNLPSLKRIVTFNYSLQMTISHVPLLPRHYTSTIAICSARSATQSSADDGYAFVKQMVCYRSQGWPNLDRRRIFFGTASYPRYANELSK